MLSLPGVILPALLQLRGLHWVKPPYETWPQERGASAAAPGLESRRVGVCQRRLETREKQQLSGNAGAAKASGQSLAEENSGAVTVSLPPSVGSCGEQLGGKLAVQGAEGLGAGMRTDASLLLLTCQEKS